MTFKKLKSLSTKARRPFWSCLTKGRRPFLTNYNLTILDIAKVTIGDHVMIGPNVDIYTVNHPLDKEGRRHYHATALPVTIGNDVWIGGKATILPGVTIGDNVVVAAGAVETKDVPANTIVAGVPARVIKELPE